MKPARVPSWLLAAAMALPLIGLSAPLIEIDDARYAEVPREMAASGDWTVPTLNGLPYVEKPPLWYWTAAASYRILGVSEAAARLPFLLLALLGLAGVWWLGSWLYSPFVGRTAALATATSALWLFLSHNMTLDLPVSVFLLWTTALSLRVMTFPEDARWAAPLAWIAAALAFLSKGLISVVFPAAWVCGLAVLYPETRRGARRLLSPLGVGLAALVAAPWFLAVQARRPDFLHTFFVEQHFQRFLTPRYARGGGWWYYLVVAPAGLLPWTVPAMTGLAAALRRPFGPDRRGPMLAAWILGVGAFFTASSSKLATYILPVIPHLCLLAAAALERGLPRGALRASRALGALLGAAALAALALTLAGFTAKGWPPPGASPELALCLSVTAVALLAALGAGLLAAPSSKTPGTILGLAGVAAGALALSALRAAAPLTSAKDLALAVRDAAGPADAIWTYGTYLHGLPFYARRPVDKMVYFVGEFHYAKREAVYRERFGDDNDARTLPRAGGKTFVALRSFERPHFETLPAKGTKVSWRDFGRWALAEIEPENKKKKK